MCQKILCSIFLHENIFARLLSLTRKETPPLLSLAFQTNGLLPNDDEKDDDKEDKEEEDKEEDSRRGFLPWWWWCQ